MAFAKTPKQIRIAVSWQLHLNFKLSGIKTKSTLTLQLDFQSPWPISQTLRWKNAIFSCLWNHSVLPNGKLSYPNGQNSISLLLWKSNYWHPVICIVLHPVFYSQEEPVVNWSLDQNQIFQRTNQSKSSDHIKTQMLVTPSHSCPEC